MNGLKKMKTDEIYCGDAYELIKEIPDKSIDLIMTDPPYKIDGLHAASGILKIRKCGYLHTMEDHDLGQGIDLSILDEFVRVMKKINVFIWCNKEQIYDYIDYFVKKHNCAFEIIILATHTPAPFTYGHFLKDKEYCLYFREKGVKLQTKDYSMLHTIYYKNSQEQRDGMKLYGHPTIKPEKVIESLISVACEVGGGGIVLDPFIGSGTTAVACKRLGLHYIGFEISEEFYKVAKDRVNGITKKEKEEGQMKLF